MLLVRRAFDDSPLDRESSEAIEAFVSDSLNRNLAKATRWRW
jgi:hypothetical protein